MTTSSPDHAFVWAWLPGATDPVVAGRLDASGSLLAFTYGRSYLARPDAIALYLPELPLATGRWDPPPGLDMPGCIADAGPDSWGRRVVEERRAIGPREARDLPPISYLLESASDRIGGLDFQQSATEYVPRVAPANLADMQDAARRLELGEAMPEQLDTALLHGTSVGGARPKALLDDGARRLIAKFSSTSDHRPVVKHEALAMILARRVGLDVAPVEVFECVGRDVLLVERFDRTASGARRLMVSGLTMLGLPEMMGRYATYPDLADLVRERFRRPRVTLHEMFARIVFNVAVGNTDDHARNHAAFWDGRELTLTPAYDVCPQLRSGTEANQAMAIGADGQREARFATCVDASSVYDLTRAQAQEVVDRQVQVIRDAWDEAADEARLTRSERKAVDGRQFLNPWAFSE